MKINRKEERKKARDQERRIKRQDRAIELLLDSPVKPAKRSWFRTLPALTLTFVGTAVTLLSAYAFRPRISVEPVESPKGPIVASEQFLIKNLGPYSIYDVNVKLLSQDLHYSGPFLKDAHVKDNVIDSPYFFTIPADSSAVFSLAQKWLHDDPIALDSGEIVLETSYRPAWIPKRWTTRWRFVVGTRDDKKAWLPKSINQP